MPLQTTVAPIINAEQFRSDFREFTDTNKYDDTDINYWLIVATLLLNPVRWGNLLQLGVELYVAHNMVLEAQSQDTAIAGGWPGLTKGTVTGESAGAVSISFDSAPVIEEGAGHWNETKYGTRFIRLAKMAGAGPIQIGPCGDLAGTVPGFDNGSGDGWSGPPCNPGILG